MAPATCKYRWYLGALLLNLDSAGKRRWVLNCLEEMWILVLACLVMHYCVSLCDPQVSEFKMEGFGLMLQFIFNFLKECWDKNAAFPVLVTYILSIPVEYFREVSLFHAPAGGPPVFQCSYPPGTVPGAFQMFINSHSTILSIGSVWLPQVDVCGDLKSLAWLRFISRLKKWVQQRCWTWIPTEVLLVFALLSTGLCACLVLGYGSTLGFTINNLSALTLSDSKQLCQIIRLMLEV